MLDRRRAPKAAGAMMQFLSLVGRLILPVVLLLGVFALCWTMRERPAPDFAASHGLALGVLLLPLAFFVINLVSRRYGPSVTLLAIVLSWVLLAGGLYWGLSRGFVSPQMSGSVPMSQAAAFAMSFLIAEIICVYFFEWLRGIPWWQAPLVAALAAGLSFTFLFHALDFGFGHGTFEGMWSGPALWPRLAGLSALQVFWAVGQLLPTAALRRVIRPLPGLGGA
jgi:uncharacterized PurR-regulated membrane protein YhhQ (DUF165 family)